jgi:hypothetical protein
VGVTEKDGLSYFIKVYEAEDFSVAKEIFDDICAGEAEAVMKELLNYYTYDPCRTFTAKLLESVYDKDQEMPLNTLVVESCELNALVKAYASSISKHTEKTDI